MSSVNDFLSSFMQLVSLKQNQDRLDEQKNNDRIQGINTFLSLARQTANPQDHVALVDQFAQAGVAPAPALTQMLANVQPTEEAQKAYQVQTGTGVIGGKSTGNTALDNLAAEVARTSLAGEGAGQMAGSLFRAGLFSGAQTTPALQQQALASAAGGAGIGDVVTQSLVASRPTDAILRGITNKEGQTLTAQEQAQNQMELLRMNYERQHQLASLGLSRAGLEAQIIHEREMEAQGRVGLGLEAQKGSAANAPHIASLLAEKASIQKTLMTTKDNPEPGLVASIIGSLNGINAQLRAAGVPTEGDIPFDPRILVNPTDLTHFMEWLKGQQHNLPIQNQPQAGGRGAPPPSRP